MAAGSPVPYLTNERSHHMLSLLKKKKNEMVEKKHQVEEFIHRFF